MLNTILKFLTFIFLGILFAGCTNQVNTPNNYKSTSTSREVVLNVTSSTPQYKTIIKRTPYQECWDEQVPVNNGNMNGNVGALIGGVAGGILGHQIGGGSGKTAATVGGAIIGTLVGKNLSQNQNNGTTYQSQRRCATRYDESRLEKFMGYKNTAYYDGQPIIRYSQQPLKTIILNVYTNY